MASKHIAAGPVAALGPAAADVAAPRGTLRSAADLVAARLARADDVAALDTVTGRYALAITPAVAALAVPGDPADPIARQFVPSAAEFETHPAERADPIGDHVKSSVAGLVHRYPDRVLLKIVGVCPVYCRFCFRREMVGPEAGRTLSDDEVTAALQYIRAHRQIWEVILTGGDPFVLSERRVRAITGALGAIAHVKVLRWHTRVPVADPARVTPGLVAALKSCDKTVVVGLHCNHPRELTAEARRAIARLADAGLPLVSQTVLLKGVNDDADTIEALMRAFVETRVLPYYIHHPDLAPGTSHFRLPVADGIAIVRDVHRRISGLARPDYVLDLPGAFGKVSLLSSDVRLTAEGCRVRDSAGRIHSYRDALPSRADPDAAARPFL